MPLAQGVLAGRSGLAAAAQLLHGFCFDRVELDRSMLSYEPRWSCQCRACAAVWVASKSGAVMRVALSTASGRPEQIWFPGIREARTVYHQHDGAPLGGEPGESFLLIGRDDGTLDIISDRHPEWTAQPPPSRKHGPLGSFHLTSWSAQRDTLHDIAVTEGVARSEQSRDPEVRYTVGVTAIAVLPRRDLPGTADILVATRAPALHVITASNGRLRLRQSRPMPGWIEWIVAAPSDGDGIACISRGGDFVRLSRGELLEGRDRPTTKLPLLPTAAMPMRGGSVLLGTTTGLVLVRGEPPRAITIPITRSPVLCLDRVDLRSGGETYEYISMGLEDGRLRVVDAALLGALADGGERPEFHNHSFTIDMRSAVLVVETLRPDGAPDNVAYVFAVLRDHTMCLFHVTDLHAQRAKVLVGWLDHVRRRARVRADEGRDPGPASMAPRRVTGGGSGAVVWSDLAADELAAAREPGPDDWKPDVWKYMLIDVVLPRLRDQVAVGSKEHLEIVELACKLAGGADRLVLHRLTVTLGQLSGDDVGLILELSRSVLGAVPHGHDRRWEVFIAAHLRELNVLAGRAEDGDRARMVAWARFVRKYVLLGNMFTAKQFGLAELVEQTYQTHKYVDALIYQARLSQRGYDLRWKHSIGADVAALHTVDCDDGYTVVAVVTVDGGVAFLDGSTGRQLTILDGDQQRRELTPFAGRGLARTLSCAVVRDGELIRVVLSCTGLDGLAVLELRWHAPARGCVELVRVSSVACTQPSRVYALHPVPGLPDRFVAGLETRAAPLGLLSRHAGDWTLEPATDDVLGEPAERPSLTPGKMPTRALAVVAVDDQASRYLAVAGADDGLVRVISFGGSDAARDWKISRWDRVSDAIGTVVLGRHQQADPERDPDDSLFSCYLGTSAGDIFALSILTRDKSGTGATVLSFGDYDAQPLWRDTHDGPVLSVGLWRTPLFASGEVLIVVTEKGRLCVYNHTPYSEEGRVSASYNYYFQGMRFDRIAMPDRLRALTMIDGGREFVAAGPGGQLYLGRLAYLRDSVDRTDPEPARSQLPPHGDELPVEMWARLDHLLAMSTPDAPFRGNAADPRKRKLDLCDLVRLEGGALSSYVLRERLRAQEPWNRLDAHQLGDTARRLLRRLDPERPEHAQRFKVIIKSLTRGCLDHVPRELATQLLNPPERHAQTAVMCTVVADYLTHDLAYSTDAAARLRIVAVKELLRVPVLRHMAVRDDHGNRCKIALETALDCCLRDDDHLVRAEALRALSIMLRNVGVMASGVPEAKRAPLIDALFPRGLGSLEWLLELIVAGLQRFPSFTRRTALVSGAWYHISALLPLFRIFPDRTLALCDYLIRAGLSIEVLAMCFHSLRGKRVAATRNRIANLYLIPALEPQHARDAYIERYDKRKPGHRDLLEEMRLTPQPAHKRMRAWHEIDDAAMADRLTQLLDQLARMWSVKRREQIGVETTMARTAITGRDAPFAALEAAVADLASVAADLATPSAEVRALEQLADLGMRHGSSVEGRSELTAPQRTIVSGIVTAWRDVYNPRPAHAGMRIGKYRLGASISGGFESLFELDEPPGPDRPPGPARKRVIKVLRQLKSPTAASRFLAGARFNQELYERSPDKEHLVEVIDIQDEPPYLAYVMPSYLGSLQDYLKLGHFHATISWVERAAEHVGRALRAAHMRDRCHGDVKPTNILVSKAGDKPAFHLGDFDLSYSSDGETEAAIGIVPECLSQKYQGNDPLGQRQWDDIAALALILYQMLTGKALDPRATTSLGPHVQRLHELASDDRIKSRLRAPLVIHTLLRVFNERERAFDIHEFLRSTRGSTTRILLLAANPLTTRPLDLEREFSSVIHQLRASAHGAQIECEIVHAVTPAELQRWVRIIQPAIVHFGGHGSPQGIILQDDQGGPKPVSGETLRQFFLDRGVELVVLNACYTNLQASGIGPSVRTVVGARDILGDETARRFATAFYRALGDGLAIRDAFRDACDAIAFDGQTDVFKTAGPIDAAIIRTREPTSERPAVTGSARTGDVGAVPGPLPMTQTSAPPVGEESAPAIDVALGRPKGIDLDGDDATPLAPSVYLNAWFPEHPGARVVLRVGATTRLHVNLAPHARGLLAAGPVADDAMRQLYQVPYVDVMVFCAGAEVAPLRARLPLPPDANAIARFELTPRIAGELALSAVLLIDGEAVHRSDGKLVVAGPVGEATKAAPWP